MTIPSQEEPVVEETPPFARALTTAVDGYAGPLRNEDTKENFSMSPCPIPSGTPTQIEEYLEGFNRGTIISTAIHEVYPGHYVQYSVVAAHAVKGAQAAVLQSQREGWAHYTEQMMLDEGYGNGDPQIAHGTVAGRAAARCALHRRDSKCIPAR